MLENGGLKVPLYLQNRSLTVRDEDDNCLGVQVPEALEEETGWRFSEHGLLVGSLLISRFVDPIGISEVEESPGVDENHFGEKRSWMVNA